MLSRPKKSAVSRKTIAQYRSKKEFTAPSHLSIVDNPEESNAYFINLRTEYKKVFDRDLYFDLSRIETLTIDAVMYILAIVQNMKFTNIYRITFAGNAPENFDANKIFEDSGFYKYVRSTKKLVDEDSARIQIKTGSEIAPKLAGSIIDFAEDHCINKRILKRLYPILIELMDNTTQHAYESDNDMRRNWYIYVEDAKNVLNFTFLDTGLGIPNTVNKRFKEKVANLFVRTDAQLLLSALQGEFRSSTKMPNRGKGLLDIYESHQNHEINNLVVVSGNGMVSFDQGVPIKSKLENAMQGTLLVWSLRKTEVS